MSKVLNHSPEEKEVRFEYIFDDSETTALDLVFDELFRLVTEAENHNQP